MTFKKGDKVEYRGGVWVFERYSDTTDECCFIERGEYFIIACTADLKPIKSAHDKLIEMGFVSNEPMKYRARLVEYDEGKRIGDSIYNATMTIVFSLDPKWFYVCVEYDHKEYETPKTVIDFELAKVAVQYLEEMEDTK